MTFSLPHSWVWDFWLADDGVRYHLYYLHAPKSLIDAELRHRHASIGHAVSTDLRHWDDRGPVLGHGALGALDESATWTGSVFRDPAGCWRMYYTGSRFLSPGSRANVETVLMATSHDLHRWEKAPATRLSADPRWYESLADETWHEEAWRDPWVFADRAGGFHMLLTARTRCRGGDADPRDRGVIGHATSADLVNWKAAEPLSRPGAGFAHLEVVQLVDVDGRAALIFSCDTSHLAGRRTGGRGGVWALPLTAPLGEGGLIDVADARLLVSEELYAGRIVKTRAGSSVLLGFENVGTDAAFVGRLSDPMPVRWGGNGRLVVARAEPDRPTAGGRQPRPGASTPADNPP